MRNFNYTARDKSGAMKRGSMQAADRNAVLHEMAAQGLVPLSVVEADVKTTTPSRISKAFWVVAGFAVITGMIAIGLNLIPKYDEGTVKKTKKTQVKKASQVAPRSATTGNATNEIQNTSKALDKNKMAPKFPMVTNAVVKPKIQVIELYPGCTTNPPLTGYSSITERLINMIINVRLGMPPPILFDLPANETNIVEILNSDIIVYETDDDKKIQQKTNVAYAKQLLKEYIEGGGNAKDFLKFYHEKLISAFDYRSGVQKQFFELLKSGDEKAYSDFYLETNKTLSEQGIVPLSVPPWFKKNEK
jgi:hypothetical protein